MGNLSEIASALGVNRSLALPRDVPCPLVRGTCKDDFCEAPETRRYYIEKHCKPCHSEGRCVALLIYSDRAAQEIKVYRIADSLMGRGKRGTEKIFDLL